MCGVLADSRNYRGLNDYQYDSGVHLRYDLLQSYKEYGSIILGPLTLKFMEP